MPHATDTATEPAPDTATETGVIDMDVIGANVGDANAGHGDSATPQDVGATPPQNRLWRYVGIGGLLLGLCAALLSARKKKSAM